MTEAMAGELVTIARLGAKGDGIVETADGPVYVSFALPGERWRLGGEEDVAELVTPAPDRQQPLCRHFGKCGGCLAQHMPAELYRVWKEDILRQALAHRGIDAKIEPMRIVAAHSRRRAFFGVARRGGGVVLGFREEGQHKLVDLSECPVLDPAIVAAMPALREMAGQVLAEDSGGRLIVTRVEDGLDVAIEGGRKDLGPDVLARLARLAASARWQRLTVDGTIVFMQQAPVLRLGGARVEIPQGAFLQAVPEAETIMIDLVTAAVGKAKNLADLFSGLGTFAFPLARKSRVLAVDSERRSIEALEKAARGATGLKPIATKVRDLMREPLSRTELAQFDAVVIDPPRAGAKDQVEALARAKVPRVVMVSCNPATFARDARTLIDGGYKISKVTPIDQFLFSPHLEVVAAFSR